LIGVAIYVGVIVYLIKRNDSPSLSLQKEGV